jgi:hypothetical protein
MRRLAVTGRIFCADWAEFLLLLLLLLLLPLLLSSGLALLS